MSTPSGFAAQSQAEAARSSHPGLLVPSDPVLRGLPVGDPTAPNALYGDDSVRRWNLNALGRPSSRWRNWGRVNFGELRGDWLITAKDIALVTVNPDHPGLPIRSELIVKRNRLTPPTVEQIVLALRDYFQAAHGRGMPTSIADWQWEHFDEALSRLERDRLLPEARVRKLEYVPRLLFSLRDVIPGAPQTMPWAKPALSPFMHLLKGADDDELKTQPVDPDLYFPLIQAALAYVQVFASDILLGTRQLKLYEARRTLGAPDTVGANRRVAPLFAAYFADPDTRIPVRSLPQSDADADTWDRAINWDMLVLQVTGDAKSGFRVRKGSPAGRAIRARAISFARLGRHEIGGVCTPEQRLAGRADAWSRGLDKIQLGNEVRMLRTACYIVVTGLTMMRDSEVQELERGCLTTYMGTPAIRSRLVKGELSRPYQYWWVTDVVAQAVAILEEITTHDTRLFSSSRSTRAQEVGGFSAALGIRVFRERINETANDTGLQPIPEGAVTPHMLRRTMALLTERESGGQLAARHQLKHAVRVSSSNALTGAYTAETQRWAEELKEGHAVAEAREAIDELASAPANRPIGPGGPRLRRAVGAIAAVVDKGTRARLLAQDFPDLRIGSANVCLGDPRVAACLTPEEQENGRAVRPTACDPGRCANSVLLPQHEPLWNAEEASLTGMLRTPRLSNHARALIEHRLHEVRQMTKEPK